MLQMLSSVQRQGVKRVTSMALENIENVNLNNFVLIFDRNDLIVVPIGTFLVTNY